MEYIFVKGIKILEVENVKVNEVRDTLSEPSNITRGKLVIYYFAEYDRYILCLNSFEYALSPNLTVLASLNVERGFRSYTLPNVGGHYILNLKTTPLPAVIKNLEMILANYNQLSYQQGQEKTLEDQANRRGDENMNSHSGYQATFEQNSNQLSPKTIQELKGISALENEIVDFKRTEIIALITLSSQFEKEEVITGTIIKPKNADKQQDDSTELENSTLKPAKDVSSGKNEASKTIANAWRLKKANQKNNQVAKPVQDELVNPSQPSGNQQQYQAFEPIVSIQPSEDQQFSNESQQKPYVFSEPKYTQPPVIEKTEKEGIPTSTIKEPTTKNEACKTIANAWRLKKANKKNN